MAINLESVPVGKQNRMESPLRTILLMLLAGVAFQASVEGYGNVTCRIDQAGITPPQAACVV